MKLSALFLSPSLLLAATLFATSTNAYTNPITIQNYKMYDAKTGAYFGVKGVDYYPRPNAGELNENNLDLFTDEYEAIWTPDLAHLAALGANAVRLYAVDPSKAHSKFMCALRSHGMYALVDMGANCEGCSITKDVAPACYPVALKTRGQQVINAFAKYDNVLAFSAGNEINDVADHVADNAPCQKKFIRDMRAYIASCATLRQIPVGVVLADSGGERDLNAKYYNCRTNASDTLENAEWYGLNVYLHCDGAITAASQTVGPGFKKALADFTSYGMNIPVVFTEFGCLSDTFPTVDGYKAQRTWLQAGWMHNQDFRKQFNGGFAFEFSTENANSKADSAYPFIEYGPQNFGLGYYSPKNCDHKTTPCEYNRMPNFDDLATEYNAIDYSDEPQMSGFTPDDSKKNVPTCPSDFKKLSEISWTAVETVSLGCPAQPLEYTCPNQVSSGEWTPARVSSATNAPTEKPAAPEATTAKPTTPEATTTAKPTTPSPSGTTSTTSDAARVMQGALVATCVASAMLAAGL